MSNCKLKQEAQSWWLNASAALLCPDPVQLQYSVVSSQCHCSPLPFIFAMFIITLMDASYKFPKDTFWVTLLVQIAFKQLNGRAYAKTNNLLIIQFWELHFKTSMTLDFLITYTSQTILQRNKNSFKTASCWALVWWSHNQHQK